MAEVAAATTSCSSVVERDEGGGRGAVTSLKLAAEEDVLIARASEARPSCGYLFDGSDLVIPTVVMLILLTLATVC